MQTTILGRTGLTVSRMGMGAGGPSQIGKRAGLTESESADILKKAFDAGVNFVDSSEGYGTEPILGLALNEISLARLLAQLVRIAKKFKMETQPQLLLLQKTMVVVEGVARKLNPNTNIWETSKPDLEKWLKETKDPIANFTDALENSAEVLKKLPELPKIMEKANQALTYMASGNIPQNSNSYSALKEKEMEMKSFRNQSIIGLLLLVFLGFIVF